MKHKADSKSKFKIPSKYIESFRSLVLTNMGTDRDFNSIYFYRFCTHSSLRQIYPLQNQKTPKSLRSVKNMYGSVYIVKNPLKVKFWSQHM